MSSPLRRQLNVHQAEGIAYSPLGLLFVPQGSSVFPLRNRPQSAKCGDRKHRASSWSSEVMASVVIPASASWVTDTVPHDGPSIQCIYCFLEISTQSSDYCLKWHLSSAFSRLLQCSIRLSASQWWGYMVWPVNRMARAPRSHLLC